MNYDKINKKKCCFYGRQIKALIKDIFKNTRTSWKQKRMEYIGQKSKKSGREIV